MDSRLSWEPKASSWVFWSALDELQAERLVWNACARSQIGIDALIWGYIIKDTFPACTDTAFLGSKVIAATDDALDAIIGMGMEARRQRKKWVRS